MDSEFKKDIEIDIHSLDEQWVKQPQLYAKYAEQAVNASFDKDKLKEQLDLIEAELDTEIRSDPAKFGLDKVVEKAVANVILLQSKYQKASNAYFESVKRMKIFEVGRDSMDHKKRALEKLTDLFLSNYWADKESCKVREMKEHLERQRVTEALNSNPRLKRLKERKEET